MAAAAGMASRYRKSPVGFCRWNTMVLSSGVSIPEMAILSAGLFTAPFMPSTVPS